MRRFVTLFVATVAGLIVLLGFKTAPARAPRPVALSGATPGASSTAPDSSTPLSSAPASSAPASSAAGSPTATPTPAPTAKPTPKPSNTTKTLTGTAVTVGEGRRVFGVVQVRLTLTNGKITAADAIQVPQNDGHSLDLSNYSIPTLSQEVVSAQSASIDAVSGATYTSEAYAQSVQAALDAAKA
ncbi:MAG TPA: FMN-binding protein [Acidothermaceae bacterium]|nr:FMN-binding protein [Acidothermaceae bacterium]